MNFQRKQIPFLHRGMNWNAPAEKLAEGQVQWAKNARVYEQGVINGAHGFTQRYVPPDISPSGFMHSYARLNILNPSFSAGFERSYVLGMDNDLFVFQDNATLNNSALNPLSVPGGLSGNPLSIVDMQPVGAESPWKYIGDSTTMCSTGYFPKDQPGQTRARCLSMGLPLPYNGGGPPVVVSGGNLNGSYQWVYAYRRLETGARSNPSAATRATIENPPTTGTNFQVQLQLPGPPVATGDATADVTIDVYRFGGVIARWALVGSGAPGSIFYDNTADESLLAAPSPPQITDQNTGLTRFNMYQPFVTQDISRSGDNATLARPDSLTPFTLGASAAWPAFGSFNPNWLPGSTIYIGGVACTIYQVDSSGLLIELMDDLTGKLAPGTYSWYTDAGTLQSGQPLPHLWGPYGIGQGGSYIFACGDPNSRGSLYWTNGNDPDSTDVVNNIIVTSASEKLVTGCIYNGQPYAWSTERQFQVFPSLTIFGQFTTQEVAGAKGCWLEWSLSVQNNGIADQSVTWRGKDGIYDMSSANGLQRLTDPLYGFFPHDNNPGLAPETLIVQIASYAQHPETVGNLDDTQPKYHRLEWFQGMLYYDFVALTTDAGGLTENTYSTLVWDTVQIPGGGWVSLDQPFANTKAPVFRSSEIGANDAIDTIPETGPIGGPASRGGNLAILRSRDPGTGQTIIYDYFGYQRGFEVRVITRAEDMGDSRAPKAWGDYWVDCIPINPITFYPLYDYNIGPLLPSTANPGQLPGPPSQRSVFTFDFLEFKPLGPYPSQLFLNQTLGLDIRWTAADGQFSESIIQWQPSYIPKPEFIEFRATDPNDGGVVQAKYLMGANIEANTLNVPIEVALYVDTQPVTVLKMQHNYQSILPYAWEPVAGYEFVVQLFVGPTVNALQIFNINWIFEPWPDFVARKYPFTNLGETSDKFIQGIVLPMETGGNPCTVGIRSDDNPSVTQQWTKTTPNLVKTGVVLNIEQPFTAHFLQFQTITPGRIWPNEARVVFEPIPEVVNTWQTQQTDFDMGGWSSLRDAFIAYMGNGDAPVLSITTEYGTVQYPLDLMGVGQYTRCYRVLQPQKAKWHSFRVESPNGVRLYQKDTVIRAKEWGSMGPYVNIQPFGDLSRTSGARM